MSTMWTVEIIEHGQTIGRVKGKRMRIGYAVAADTEEEARAIALKDRTRNIPEILERVERVIVTKEEEPFVQWFTRREK